MFELRGAYLRLTSSSLHEAEQYMSTSESLKDVYSDELKDLWSANDQMAKVVKVMVEKATDKGLKSMLTKSIGDITKHAEAVKALLLDADEEAKMEHCKGMEGLVKEATKHITKEA